MQDGYETQALPQRRSGRMTLGIALLAFVAGAILVGWLAWQGMLIPDKSGSRQHAANTAIVDGAALPTPSTSVGQAVAETPAPGPYANPLSTVETRLALLEERLSRLDTTADAASGNAARAEGLLVAFAARRMTDKGEKLGYLEDQLKLRFTNAQPLAVDTVITFARKPVTLDGLSSRLEAMAPDLAASESAPTGWSRIRSELASLFVVRTDSSVSRKAEDRIVRARLMLANGRVDQAIEEVQRLPNAEAAEEWISDARRYAAAQRALDIIETTAMLEPQRLQDGEGRAVDQPSPLASPPASAAPEATRPGFSTAG